EPRLCRFIALRHARTSVIQNINVSHLVDLRVEQRLQDLLHFQSPLMVHQSAAETALTRSSGVGSPVDRPAVPNARAPHAIDLHPAVLASPPHGLADEIIEGRDTLARHPRFRSIASVDRANLTD